MATEYSTGLNRFALLVSGLVLVVGLGMAWLRVDAGDPAWLYAVPVLFAPATYAFLVRRREERLLPTTMRGYTLHSAKFVDHTLGELLPGVAEHGYRLEVFDLKEGAPATDATPLRNCELRLKEQRAPVSYGDVVMRLTVHDNGAVLGYLEATDSQPGFYDELAQFVLVELEPLWDAVEFTHSAGGARRPLRELRGELPTTPYGLSLLD